MASLLGKLTDTGVILCAFVVTGITVSRWFRHPDQPGAMHHIDNWKSELAFPRQVGPAKAPYRVVVWTDYQCPACKQFEHELAAAKDSLRDSLTVIYRYFPLTGHPLAFKAAVLAECASKQGKFASMHATLFAASLRGDSINVDSVARVAGVPDLNVLRTCLADTTGAATVQADMARGRALDLHGTPSVQIGDQLGTGSIPSPTLVPQLRRAKRVKD